MGLQLTLLIVMFAFGHQDSRKFIDLLLQVTNNKWANIDVNKEVKVGDFGRVDQTTGEFLVEGNLYELAETKPVMESYPVQTTVPTKFEKYLSKGVKEVSISPSVNVGIPSIADVGFVGKWEFKSNKGALLVLLAPRISTMRGFPTGTMLEKRFESVLKHRVVCTDVVSCPAVCLYLGRNKDHVFELSLKTDAPIPVAAPVTVGGNVDVKWNSSNAQGLIKEGVDPDGKYSFYPLYGLKQVNWGRVGIAVRGDRPGNGEEDVLEEVYAPWDELDDEGEELDFAVDSGEPIE
ncbi:hypothetical protein D9758_015401 [Tetrapyrgos nigripes]|uniref:Uncharacterized protein n=1 Tax=Tetrapyrgos nigripes TaxID=182062 RepID=A0A8H5CLK3_9AGAR|nr:hypothetical protein D9758_015401 [Tetrapyrgos nigripes]